MTTYRKSGEAEILGANRLENLTSTCPKKSRSFNMTIQGALRGTLHEMYQ
jgi:hypothetical protein